MGFVAPRACEAVDFPRETRVLRLRASSGEFRSQKQGLPWFRVLKHGPRNVCAMERSNAPSAQSNVINRND
jgi:hypothetical protein